MFFEDAKTVAKGHSAGGKFLLNRAVVGGDADAGAGLEVVAVHGHVPGHGLQPTADESRHPKAVVLARRPATCRVRNSGSGRCW